MYPRCLRRWMDAFCYRIVWCFFVRVFAMPYITQSAGGESDEKDENPWSSPVFSFTSPLLIHKTLWFLPCTVLHANNRCYLGSNVCIWLKTTKQQVPLDLVWNGILHATIGTKESVRTCRGDRIRSVLSTWMHRCQITHNILSIYLPSSWCFDPITCLCEGLFCFNLWRRRDEWVMLRAIWFKCWNMARLLLHIYSTLYMIICKRGLHFPMMEYLTSNDDVCKHLLVSMTEMRDRQKVGH